MGRRVRAVPGAERQETVAVDRFDAHRRLTRGRVEHPRKEGARELVGHDGDRPCGEGGEKTAPGARLGFDVRVVRDAGRGEARRLVGHPVEDEPVQTVAGVPVPAAQGLEDEERTSVLACQRDGPLSAKFRRVRRAAVIQ